MGLHYVNTHCMLKSYQRTQKLVPKVNSASPMKCFTKVQDGPKIKNKKEQSNSYTSQSLGELVLLSLRALSYDMRSSAIPPNIKDVLAEDMFVGISPISPPSTFML